MTPIRVRCIRGAVQRVRGSVATRIDIKYIAMHTQVEKRTRRAENGLIRLLSMAQLHFCVDATDECKQMLWMQL